MAVFPHFYADESLKNELQVVLEEAKHDGPALQNADENSHAADSDYLDDEIPF